MKLRVIHGLILFIGALTAIMCITGCLGGVDESESPHEATTTDAPTQFEVTADTALVERKRNTDPYSEMSCSQILDLYAKEVNDYVESKRKNKIDFDKTSSRLLECDLQKQLDSMDIQMNSTLAKKGGGPPRD